MAKYCFLLFLFSGNFLFAKTDSSEYCEETVHFFQKIVRANQQKNGFIRWKKDIKIFFHELKQDDSDENSISKIDYDYLKTEFKSIIDELNQLIETIQIDIVENQHEANFEVFVGSTSGCKLLDASTRFSLAKNWGIQHSKLSMDGNEILESFVFVDLYRTPNLRLKKRMLRKKITQALGFFNELQDKQESIFYDGFSENSNFSSQDLDFIKMLYNQEEWNLGNESRMISELKSEVKILNNPSNDFLSFSVTNDLLNEVAYIYNSQGQLVINHQIEMNNSKLSLMNLNPGVYFLQINKLAPVRFIKG